MGHHIEQVDRHKKFLAVALEEARNGYNEGGIPIGSVMVYKEGIIGRGHNRRIQQGNPILHAEMDALQNAGRLPASVYAGCTLYTTLSPCSMCSGAILLYHIRHVVIGENRSFAGSEDLLRSQGVSVDVIDDADCYNLLHKFIAENASVWHEDIGEEPTSPRMKE